MNIQNDPAPIAVFVYKRPEHTRRLFLSLSKNKEFDHSKVVIFSDGPRSEDDRPSVVETRKWLEDNRMPNWELRWSEVNRGLAASIIAGVSELVATYGRVIVLEDDLEVSEQFISYMNRALDFYKQESQVLQISGYCYPISRDGLPETFFFRNATSWGWATWERAWKLFNENASDLYVRIGRLPNGPNRFDIDGIEPFYEMLRRQRDGEIDSWAIRWDASVFLNEGLCLYPGSIGSLVRNHGFDGTGENSGSHNIYDSVLCTQNVTSWSNDIRESKLAANRIKEFFYQNRPGRFARFTRYLKKIFS